MKARLIKILAFVAISIALLYFAGIYLVNKAFDILILSQIGDLNFYKEFKLEESETPSLSDNLNDFEQPEPKDKEVNKETSKGASDVADINYGIGENKNSSDANSDDKLVPAGNDYNKHTKNADSSATVSAEVDATEKNTAVTNKPKDNTAEANTPNTNNMDASDTKPPDTNGSAGRSNNQPDREIQGTSRQEVAITEERVKELENKVSLSDKGKALQIVASRLKAEDISLLRSMAKNGITAEEIEMAKKILKERITEEEKEFLKGLLSKYNIFP
ncbi:MAG TPA: hypothetical protein GXX20_09115 [Clostridiaceae bacterium]|nr:hypothetical protein [Clostridiaceae bacterium]